MKKTMVSLLVLLGVILTISQASAGSCYSDSIVMGWIAERDRAERTVIQAWAKGASPQDLAPDIALLLSNEFYICSKCRDNTQFLKNHLHILNNGSSPKVETVPAMILERLIGYPILSPHLQFAHDNREGGE